jgi:hypothetical protein
VGSIRVAPEETIFIYNSLIFNHLNNFVKRLFQQSRINASRPQLARLHSEKGILT